MVIIIIDIYNQIKELLLASDILEVIIFLNMIFLVFVDQLSAKDEVTKCL